MPRLIAISSVFSIKPNKVKKVSKSSSLKEAENDDKMSIINIFILSKSLLSKLLSKFNFISLKFIIYWANFLSKY